MALTRLNVNMLFIVKIMVLSQFLKLLNLQLIAGNVMMPSVSQLVQKKLLNISLTEPLNVITCAVLDVKAVY